MSMADSTLGRSATLTPRGRPWKLATVDSGDPSLEQRGAGLAYFDLPTRHDPIVAALSPAERAVLRLVVRGAPNEVIAWARASSTRTVANQVASLLAKTGAGSRHELAARYGDLAFAVDGLALMPARARGRSAGSPCSLLLVEDDEDARLELSALFESRGFSVTAADCADAARSALGDRRFEVAVLDVRLPDGSASELVGEVGAPTVLISGVGSFEEVAQGLALGASEFVPKSAPMDVLLAAVQDALLRGDPGPAPDLASVSFASMQRLDVSDARRRILRGELRCLHVSDWPGFRRVALAPTASRLSARTSAVAQVVASGAGMKQVADRVGVSEATAWLELRQFLDHSGFIDRLQVTRLLGPLSEAEEGAAGGA